MFSIHLATEKDLQSHQADDLFDLETLRVVKWPSTKELTTFPEALEHELQTPLNTIRCLQVIKRTNQTYRPTNVVDLPNACNGKKMKRGLMFYLETKEEAEDMMPSDHVVFLKYYDSDEGKLRYIGNTWCKEDMTIGQIAKIARARLGFPEEEKLDAYEEITVSRQDALEDAQTLGDAEIGSGDIIIFQKVYEEGKRYKFASSVKEYMKSLVPSSSSSSEDYYVYSNRGNQRPAPRQVSVRPKFFNARGRKRNNYRSSLKGMKAPQEKQLAKFRKYAKERRWRSIHTDHYDWFMFPIEDGSQSNYNVLEDDVAELRADPEWLANYHESVMWVAKAWGWDVLQEKEVEPKEKGMGWDNWDVRLAKIIRSLWLFGERKLMMSMQKFARIVAPNGGLRYGGIILDEVLYMVIEGPPEEEAVVTEATTTETVEQKEETEPVEHTTPAPENTTDVEMDEVVVQVPPEEAKKEGEVKDSAEAKY